LADSLGAVIKSAVLEGFMGYLQSEDPLECFRLFDRFRILCAVRAGPWGVQQLNRLTEKILAAQGHIKPDARWYHGRPVMVRINDYNLRLFNGDVGIALSDPEAGGELRVFFPGAQGAVRKFHPLRLPEHETVFAMTVHKSQGSEFDRVLLILPDRDSPVLTRELLYTAITRAREEVAIWAWESIFTAAVARRTERMSGLRDALWA
jgi:exodeoxyribonuclease V alpha subunit